MRDSPDRRGFSPRKGFLDGGELIFGLLPVLVFDDGDVVRRFLARVGFPLRGEHVGLPAGRGRGRGLHARRVGFRPRPELIEERGFLHRGRRLTSGRRRGS